MADATENNRGTAAIERLATMQARIETLLARMTPTGENGRPAKPADDAKAAAA
jgi:hypothetical protein